MSTQLENAMKSILEMPYHKNDHATSGVSKNRHEMAVSYRLNQSGFKEYEPNIDKLGRKKLKEAAEHGDYSALLKTYKNMPDGSYIFQPAGSQGFPDILLKDFCGRYMYIECKSASKFTPMWNDNYPKQDTIYILSSNKVDATTIFLGKDVIVPEQQALALRQIEAYRKIDQEFKPEWDRLDKYNRGWYMKARQQVFQGGGKNKVNYFTHQNRLICELNVLDYARK